MSVNRIASRYAKPLLELAQERNVLKEVRNDMESFSLLCKQNRDFSLMLKSPIIPHLKKAAILKKLFDKVFDAITLQAFGLITRKNRENLLEPIADEFIRLDNEKKGISKVTLTTTIELDDRTRKSFEHLATRMSGKKPLFIEKIDQELIGGFVLNFDNKQLDESIRGRMNKIKRELLK